MAPRICVVAGCGLIVEDGGAQCSLCRVGDYDHIRKTAPAPDGNVRTHAPHEAHVLEAERQEEIRRDLLAAGWAVWRVGQRNATGTQDAGVPDLICLHRRRGVLFVEAKRPHGGVVSMAQAVFREACQAAGVPHVVASQLADLTPWLRQEVS